MSTWGQALAWGLSEINHKNDCLRLLTDRTDFNLLDVYLMLDQPYLDFALFKKDIARRKQGEPVAYITGRQDFWGHKFFVNSEVLIPRSDTEMLVESLLRLAPGAGKVLELGTGSGAVIISYLLDNSSAFGFASDISQAALDVAKDNSERLECSNLEFRLGSWFVPWFGHKFDVIISNPPYLANNDPHLLELSYEPTQALVASDRGLHDLYLIIEQAHSFLVPGGWLILEHGCFQADAVMLRFSQALWGRIECISDINGKDRVTIAQAL